MISLRPPIRHVHSSRPDLWDDNWTSVTARIELVEALPYESLDGIEAFLNNEDRNNTEVFVSSFGFPTISSPRLSRIASM